MTSVHESFLLCSAKDILRKFHQEESLAVGVKDVCQALSLVFEELADTGAGHQIEVFVVAHILVVLKTDTLPDAPIIVTDEEALPVVLFVVTVFEYELMQFRELSIAVDEDFQHEVLFLLAE